MEFKARFLEPEVSRHHICKQRSPTANTAALMRCSTGTKLRKT